MSTGNNFLFSRIASDAFKVRDPAQMLNRSVLSERKFNGLERMGASVDQMFKRRVLTSLQEHVQLARGSNSV